MIMKFEDFLYHVGIPVLIKIWLTSIVIAICALLVTKWRENARDYLTWALFPFPLLFRKKWGPLKRWLLVLFSPCVLSVFIFLFVLNYAMFQPASGIPTSIPYHNAADLRRITGVNFPDVIPVDSFYNEDFNTSEVEIKFVTRKPIQKSFFDQLKRACASDPCCWKKENEGYQYYILPERPINRLKGTHRRKVEIDGEMTDDWDGDFVSVFVPFKGDTIYVKDGWCR